MCNERVWESEGTSNVVVDDNNNDDGDSNVYLESPIMPTTF